MNNPSAGTKPRQFRIGDETLDLMDRLMAKHALKSRTAVVLMAVKQMADRDLTEPSRSRGEKKPKSARNTRDSG